MKVDFRDMTLPEIGAFLDGVVSDLRAKLPEGADFAVFVGESGCDQGYLTVHGEDRQRTLGRMLCVVGNELAGDSMGC